MPAGVSVIIITGKIICHDTKWPKPHFCPVPGIEVRPQQAGASLLPGSPYSSKTGGRMKCDEIRLLKKGRQLFVKFYNPLKRKFEKLEIRPDRTLEYEDDDCLAYIEEIKRNEHIILINFEQFNEILSLRDAQLRKYYTDFVLLHEIGHYLLAHTLMDTDQSAQDEQFLEEQADQYALQTLNPNRLLRRRISEAEEKHGYLTTLS
jgi:hypothetical protein